MEGEGLRHGCLGMDAPGYIFKVIADYCSIFSRKNGDCIFKLPFGA